MQKYDKIIYVRSTSIYNDSRAQKEISALAGQNVLVIGWDRYLDIENNPYFDGKVEQYEFFMKQLPNGSGFKGLFKTMQFALFVKNIIKRESKKNNICVHFCDFDTAVLAASYCRRKHIDYVYDIYDFYSESHSFPGVLRSIVEKMEYKVIDNSKATIICTEQRKGQIKDAKQENIVIIENTPEITEAGTIKSISGGEIKVAYIGVLSRNRLLQEILSEIDNYQNVKLTIAGFGELEQFVRETTKKCSNVKYLGKVAYKDALAIETKSDFLFATYNPEVPNHKFSAANKIYEAMALGIPIVVCKNTGMDAIVEKENFGAIIEYNAKEFFDTILDIASKKDLYKEMSKNGLEAYKKHRWSIMAERLRKIYEIDQA